MKYLLFLTIVSWLIGLGPSSAQAGYIVIVMQQGSDVVANGSGTLDVTDLKKDVNQGVNGTALNASTAVFQTGPFIAGEGLDEYESISGPTNFGSGGEALGTGTGDGVGFFEDLTRPALFVPSG
jgi:hypothetical protein